MLLGDNITVKTPVSFWVISTFRRAVLHIFFITLYYRKDLVGQVFLSGYTILNENEVTLRVDAISNICWKGHLPQ